MTGDPAEAPDGAELLAQLLSRPAWHANAACRGEGVDKWFPEKGESTEPAKAICEGCPVRSECADAAESYGADLQGVWAGLSQRQRRDARRGAA